jgi:hypothetical protein
MTPPFIPAALAPTALAGLLALVPGTSQAASVAAGSPTATAHRLVLTAATTGAYSPAGRAQHDESHARAGRSHVRLDVDKAARRGHDGHTTSPDDRRVTQHRS